MPRLNQALELARAGKGNERPVRQAALIQDFPTAKFAGRRIFDIQLPASHWNPEPYTIRIVTDAAVSVVITVLPPEFRRDMAAKKKRRELRRIVDEDIATDLGDSAEKVELPPPVKLGASLADKLRAALG